MDLSGIEILFQGRTFVRLLEGLWVTLSLALISVGLSLVLGTLLGLAMTSRNIAIRAITRVYLEIIRIVPQLVLLFLAFFWLTRVSDINLTGYQAALLVFTAWGSAETGDLVRGALTAVPAHQAASAFALSLDPAQRFLHVVLPQAVRFLLPPTVNLVTRMIKTTSIVVLIGVVEVVKVGQQIIDSNRFDFPDAAFWIYSVIFLLYFAVCYPISLTARRLEKRWAN
jgi:polar amino acid transport system permease protein